MTGSDENWAVRVEKMIRSGDPDIVKQGYDAWAESYDADHEDFGQPLLDTFVRLFREHVPRDTKPILDAGAGTGRMGEVLQRYGYSDFIGIDMSPGMLRIARQRPVYTETHCMTLGAPLGFADETFAVTASLASFAPGHAGKEAFPDLIRVTKSGGLLILALRAGCEDLTGFDAARARLSEIGAWQLIDEIPDFVSHPDAQPPLRYGVHVYRRV